MNIEDPEDFWYSDCHEPGDSLEDDLNEVLSVLLELFEASSDSIYRTIAAQKKARRVLEQYDMFCK